MGERRLILLRHGKSSWRDPTLRDRERPLKGRGRRQTAEVAQALDASEWVPDLILSSDALRARQTADIIRNTLELDLALMVTPDLYGCDADEVIEIIGGLPDSAETCLLVGHNPTWEEVVNALTDTPVTLRTADAALMTLSSPRWADAQRGPWAWWGQVGRDEAIS